MANNNGNSDGLNSVLLKLAETNEKKKVFKIIAEYLTDIIGGTACSIFLVDPNTDELKFEFSTHNFTEEEKLKLTYKRGEGFTGWPFEYKKLLYIKNEEDENEISQIKPFPPKHVGSPGKPSETEKVGPFMAAPILSGDDVVGVIRIPAINKSKDEFTDREQKLFEIFANKISSTVQNAKVMEKLDNLIEIYSEISQEQDVDKLLIEIVEGIPTIVGGGGCSVFLLENWDAKENNKFILKASTSVLKEYKDLIGKHCYIEGGPGLTAFAATTGMIVRVKDINDEKEIRSLKKNEMNIEPIHIKGKCEIDSIGPFIAIPIKYESKIIGVIRIPRHRNAKPFDGIDEKLLKAFADQLSLIIIDLRRKKEIGIIRQEKEWNFRSKFSDSLINACRDISEISYASNIKDFLDNCYSDECNTDEDISAQILSSLKRLWCNKCEMNNNFNLIKEFYSYEYMLFELPRYRDHFIHQYQVFLLGSVIIDEIYKISKQKNIKNFADYYFNSLYVDNSDNKTADTAWLLTSSFHDVAYPIERSDQLFNKFFEKFIGPEYKFIENVGLEKIVCSEKYIDLIDQLCDLYTSFKIRNAKKWEYKSLNEKEIIIDQKFKNNFIKRLTNKDHGVLGALILLSNSDRNSRDFSEIIYPSALAISLHNMLIFDLEDKENICSVKENDKKELFCKGNCQLINFEENPLAYLLIYCDLIQEWGREKENLSDVKDEGETPRANNFHGENITCSLNKNNIKVPILKCIDVKYGDDSKIHVVAKLEIDNELLIRKLEEARKVFHRLRSKEIKFEFIIESRDVHFIS